MLPLPSPPTDNLYKFKSIAGLLLMVGSILLIYTFESNINKERDKIDLITNELNILEKKVLDDRWYIQDALNDIYEKVGITKKPIINDSGRTWTPITTGNTSILNKYAEIEKEMRVLDKSELDRDSKKLQLKTANHYLDYLENEFFYLLISSGIAMLFGLSFSLSGFESWYDNHQKFHDQILEDQYKKLYINDTCQSCGVKLFDHMDYPKLEDIDKRNFIYCSHCYQNGGFTNPNLTLEEMKTEVNNQCINLGLDKSYIKQNVNKLEKLRRWKKVFKWS